MAKRSKKDHFLSVNKDKAIGTFKLLRRHKKHDKFALNYLRNYIESETYREVSKKVKQGKAKVSIERRGYSFLISGRDLLPVVKSKYLPQETLNRFIERRFLEEKNKDFSRRAWTFIPEFIGPMLSADKRAKLLLALSLFAPKVRINFVDYSDTSKRLINHASLIGKTHAKASKKPDKKYDINLFVNPPKLGDFLEMTELDTKIVHLKRGDMEFIKQYIAAAAENDVEFPSKLKKGLKEEFLPLAEASAKMELRSTVTQKDVDRIKRLNL